MKDIIGKELKEYVNATVVDEMIYNISIGPKNTTYRKKEYMTSIWTKEQSKDLDKKFTNQKEYIDKRFTNQKEYIDKRFTSQKEYMDNRFKAIENKFDKKFDDQTNFMIELFKLNGMKIPENK